MRRITLAVALVILIPSIFSGAELWAKGGRGGAPGRGGGGSNHGGGGFKPSGGKSHVPGKGHGPPDRSGTGIAGQKGNPKSTFDSPSKPGQFHTGEQPWSKDHARELQKLEHRKQVADHLRRISDQNGNENLKQVASDMEQRAQSHYEKQAERIKQKYELDELENTVTESPDAIENLAGDSPEVPARGTLDDLSEDADAIRKLTGRENALSRQIHNEERMLAKRMEAVEQMRQLGGQINDNDMLQSADRLEQWAMNHFDQRMAQITDFQQRHDLPEIIRDTAP